MGEGRAGLGLEKEGKVGVGEGRAGWGGRGAEKMVVGLWAKLKAVGLDQSVSFATWNMCLTRISCMLLHAMHPAATDDMSLSLKSRTVCAKRWISVSLR